MEVKAGYKQTEVGVIPEEWEVKRISDFASIGAGGTPSREIAAYWGGSIPWITTSKIDFGVIKEADQFITEEGLKHSAAKLLPAGTLLIALYGQGKTRGKVGVLGMPAATNQACASIALQEGVSQEFILHYLTSRYEEIRNSSNSGSQENLNGNIVKGISVVFPPYSEQRAIATALSDVDALLAALDQLLAKKRDIKLATMQQLLTGKTRLPGFSGEWDLAEFGDIATIRNEKVLCSSTPKGMPCVELEFIGQANGRLLGYIEATGASSKYSFKKGDVLFGRLRAYLRKHWMATLDGVCSTEIWPLIPRDERLYGGYLHLLVQMNSFVDSACISYGTHMPRSDWEVLGKFEVQLPLLPEQTAIAAVLSDMDLEIQALEQRLGKTRQIKQAMMQELLTGRTRLVEPQGAYS